MKIWQKIGFIVVLTLLIGYLTFVMIWLVPSRKDVLCQGVKVVVTDAKSNQFISEKDIVDFLKHKNIYPIGKTFNEISLRDMEHQLLTHASLRNAVCYQTSNGTLLVKVTQRVPVFRVMSGTSSYYVDKERKTMPTVLRQTAYVPIVTGSVKTQFATGELFDLITYIQSDNFLRSQISQIHVYPNDEIELIPRVGSQVIYLGSLENYKSKLNKLLVFYDKAIAKVGWETYSRIDLQYRDQVVCTRR